MNNTLILYNLYKTHKKCDGLLEQLWQQVDIGNLLQCWRKQKTRNIVQKHIISNRKPF